MKNALSVLSLLCATLAIPTVGFSAAPLITARAAARLLDQATWGPTTASIQQAQTLGINGWLAAQFAATESDLPDQPIDNSAGSPNLDLTPVQNAFFQIALTGQDQLRQRVAFALSEIWVVSENKVFPAYAYPVYWRLLRDNAFGNYRNIIQAMTLSPAMGEFLDMANSQKANPAQNTNANENYARELQQLFTVGLTQLNTDGSPVLDAYNNPVRTYTQAQISDTARVLTGWTFPVTPGTPGGTYNLPYYIGQMVPWTSQHDTGSKTIIGGVQIPAGQTPQEDINSLIDALMAQPTMAPFVCTQLIQHLVSSNPSPQYIQRVSNVFLNDGTGTVGNMQAVVTAILTDPEARTGDAANAVINPNFGHLREPALFVENLLRGLNATLSSNSLIRQQSAVMGQIIFEAPDVFSYFSPQYLTNLGLLGPEFQIYSTATVSARANMVSTLLYDSLDPGSVFNFSSYTALGSNIPALVTAISNAFFYGEMSTNLQQAITTAATAQTTPQYAAQAALYQALTSGEYQIVH